MLLFCLLGVILVIGGLALRRELGMILSDVRLALFGVRVSARIPERRRKAVRPYDPPVPPGVVPPPSMVTRPRR